MLQIFTASLTLLATFVVAQPHSFTSSLSTRQTTSSPSQNCNSTCDAFATIKKTPCGISHCGCTENYLQAQGDCLVCQAKTPEDAAAVQTILDAEINQCHADGIPIEFQLQLPPAAQAVIDNANRQSVILRQEQMAFLALQIMGGHIGFVTVLVFSIFSRKVRRDPTFLNFCITWVFSSIVYSLLLYRGTSGNSVANSLGPVNRTTCLAQAALTNGAQVMTSCSTMSLVIQLWIGLRTAIHGDIRRGERQKQFTTLTLLVLPYILFFAFAIPSVFVGRTNVTFEGTTFPRALQTNFYCSVIGLSSFLRGVYGVTLGLLLITAIFDVLIIIILSKHWWTFRHVQTTNAVSLSILIRVMIFSLYRVVVAVAYGTVLNKPPQVSQSGSGLTLSVSFGVPIWVDMLQAAIPLIGFLVLGLNNDMITSMMFWRWNRRAIWTIHSIRTNGTNTNGTTTNGTTTSGINTSTNTTRHEMRTLDISRHDTSWSEKTAADVDIKATEI